MQNNDVKAVVLEVAPEDSSARRARDILAKCRKRRVPESARKHMAVLEGLDARVDCVLMNMDAGMRVVFQAKDAEGKPLFVGSKLDVHVVPKWAYSHIIYSSKTGKSADELIAVLEQIPACSGYTFTVIRRVPTYMVLTPAALLQLLQQKARVAGCEIEDLAENVDLEMVFGSGEDCAALVTRAVKDHETEAAQAAELLMQ
jgi:hypothetical protein